MIIKTCGMRDADNIRAVSELGIDWMGFIFWAPSSRYVRACPHVRNVSVSSWMPV